MYGNNGNHSSEFVGNNTYPCADSRDLSLASEVLAELGLDDNRKLDELVIIAAHLAGSFDRILQRQFEVDSLGIESTSADYKRCMGITAGFAIHMAQEVQNLGLELEIVPDIARSILHRVFHENFKVAEIGPNRSEEQYDNAHKVVIGILGEAKFIASVLKYFPTSAIIQPCLLPNGTSRFYPGDLIVICPDGTRFLIEVKTSETASSQIFGHYSDIARTSSETKRWLDRTAAPQWARMKRETKYLGRLQPIRVIPRIALMNCDNELLDLSSVATAYSSPTSTN